MTAFSYAEITAKGITRIGKRLRGKLVRSRLPGTFARKKPRFRESRGYGKTAPGEAARNWQRDAEAKGRGRPEKRPA
jgi:hypothetical protein